MILHLIEDSVISDRIIQNFEEVLPNKNIYLCFIYKDVKYVKKRKYVYYYRVGGTFDEGVLNYEIQKIIIHYLSVPKIDFVDKYISILTPIYWVVWGGDVYNNLLTFHGFNIFYEPLYMGARYFIKHFLSNVLNISVIRNRIGEKTLIFVKRRVRYFVSDVDYDLLKKTFPQYIKGRQIKGFFYYPIDSIVEKDLMVDSKCKTTIIIGNSCSNSNNHLYAFKFLRYLNLREKTVVVPLSYGGTGKYKKHVIKEGYSIWGNKLRVISDFLPLEEYNRLLSTSAICIYANWRQEAMGNILTVLGLGAKVFISERNPLYLYLCQLGLIIYSLEKINQAQIDEIFPLSAITHNRKIILDNFNKIALAHGILEICGR